MVIIKKLERYKNDNYAQVTQGGEGINWREMGSWILEWNVWEDPDETGDI